MLRLAILSAIAALGAGPAWAQTAEAAAAAAKALDTVSSTGLVGSLAVLAGLAASAIIAALWIALRKSEEGRFGIAIESTKAIGSATTSLTALSVAAENSNRLSEQRFETLRAMGVDLAAIKAEQARLAEEARRIADRLPAKGGPS